MARTLSNSSLTQRESYASELAAFLNQLASGPTRTYAAWKLAVNRSVLGELDSYTDFERQLTGIVRQTQDYAQGFASFREKRAPHYTGH